MRITLDLPDDIYRIACSVATAERVSLGEALTQIIRRGLEASSRMQIDSGLPCFRVSKNAAPITLEHALDAEDDDRAVEFIG